MGNKCYYNSISLTIYTHFFLLKLKTFSYITQQNKSKREKNFQNIARGKYTHTHTHTHTHISEKAMASHGWRSLVGCRLWGCTESDTTERLHFHFSLSCIGEGNGNPLQCSCLENPRDGGAWWAAVYGVTQSRTRLKQLGGSSSRHTYNIYTSSTRKAVYCHGSLILLQTIWQGVTYFTL